MKKLTQKFLAQKIAVKIIAVGVALAIVIMAISGLKIKNEMIEIESKPLLKKVQRSVK